MTLSFTVSEGEANGKFYAMKWFDLTCMIKGSHDCYNKVVGVLGKKRAVKTS